MGLISAPGQAVGDAWWLLGEPRRLVLHGADADVGYSAHLWARKLYSVHFFGSLSPSFTVAWDIGSSLGRTSADACTIVHFETTRTYFRSFLALRSILVCLRLRVRTFMYTCSRGAVPRLAWPVALFGGSS